MRQHLGEPHDREIVNGKQAFEAVCRALWAADAGEADSPVRLLLQCAHEPSGEVIAGDLARYDKDQRLLPAHATLHTKIIPKCPGSPDPEVSCLFTARIRPIVPSFARKLRRASLARKMAGR